MSSSTVYNEIKGLLVAGVAPTPVLDFDEINDTQLQSTTPFLVLESVFSSVAVIGFGDPQNLCEREEATLEVACMVPAPESSGAARLLAEQVQTLLRLQHIRGLRVVGASPPEIDRMNDGLWTQATLLVDCEFDRFVAIP